MKNDLSDSKFVELAECYVADVQSPESAVAYTESAMRELYRRSGLQIAEPVQYGLWCGRNME